VESWIWSPITLAAALVQAVRTALQKHLTGGMGVQAATLVRFLFGLPFAAAYLAVLMTVNGYRLPELHATFLLSCVAAAAAQIVATALLIHLFTLRNFAVGTSYSRTEAFLTGLIGAAFFAEAIDLPGWLAIAISVAGVLVMTVGGRRLGGISVVSVFTDRSMAIGLASGCGFALASLFIRQASLSIGHADWMFTAAITLVTIIIVQTATLGSYIALRQPGEFLAMARQWRACTVVGMTSMLGSAGWFTAMTIERAAYVKAVGQIEFVFTLLASVYVFRERSSPLEIAGMLMVVAGIVVLLVYG
jgi:drug/metabolite transporter (DMT)-like permease